MANVSFTDFDLDLGDLGGVVTWDPPEESKARMRIAGLGGGGVGSSRVKGVAVGFLLVCLLCILVRFTFWAK